MVTRKVKIYLLLILLLASFLRLFLLDRIPVGINDDELNFIINAKSIYFNFSFLKEKSSPLSFSEASSLIFAPILGPLSTNLFTAKLPYALIGVLSIYFIFHSTLNLTNNPNLSLLTSLVASLNPWSIYTSRTAFDAPIAIFFFILCFYLMTTKKSKYILLSTIPGFLAFNSYIGTKILYFPFIFITSTFINKLTNKKFIKLFTIVTIFSLFVTLHFIISLPNQNIGNRLSELWTPNSLKIISQVNDERRQSLQPPIRLFTNKYTIYFRNFLEKYLNNFSPNILFLKGDSTYTGSLWIHGYLYYIDAFLIVLGIIFLFKKNRFFLFLLLSLIIISPIPEAIRSDLLPAYVFHSSLQYPFILVLIGSGMYFIFELSNKFKLTLMLIYILSVLNFLNIYFLKSPVYQPESFAFSRRLASKYISLEEMNNPNDIYFLTKEPETMFRTYLFFNKHFLKENFTKIKHEYIVNNESFKFNNIHFIKDVSQLPASTDYVLIADTYNFIFDTPPSLFITQLSDAGKVYSIYNSSTCLDISNKTYTDNLNIHDLAIENLSQIDFCNKFITI